MEVEPKQDRNPGEKGTEPRAADDSPEPSSFTTIRKSPGFIQMFAGQAVSAFGDWMATVAFMILTSSATGGNEIAIGGVLVLRLAPGVVAGPLAGRLARRYDYRKTMMTMDVLRALMVVVVPLLFTLWWIYLWAFLIEVASLIFIPARDSSIPELVGDEEALPLANSMILGSSFGTIPLGAGAFALVTAFSHGVTVAFIDPQTHPFVFWIDGLSYLVSLYFISRIGTLRTAHVVDPGDEEKAPEGAFREAFQIPIVRMVVLPALAITLGLGALFSMGITLVRSVMDASDAQFGLLIALFGVGAGAGIGILQLRGSERTLTDFQVAVGAVGASIFLTVLTPFLAVALVGAVFFGAAAAYAMAGGMSTLQERVEGEERVLAFTAFHVLIRAGLGVGAIVAGVLGQLAGGFRVPILGHVAAAQWVLFLSGLIVLVSALFITETEETKRASG